MERTPEEIAAIHRETGAAWNQVAQLYSHGSRDQEEVIAFLKSGGSYLFNAERELLGNMSGWCRRAIHLQCSGGLDTLSLLKQGAHEVVGVDISDKLLDSARLKAQALGASADWHLCDVLEAPAELNGTADLVYTGKGALCWMMDIEAWAATVSRLLKPDGKLFLYESHPINWVWDTWQETYALNREHGDYFSDCWRVGLPIDGAEAIARYRQWTLCSVVNAVIGAGFAIDRLCEYHEPFWNEFPNMPPETLRRLPHSYALMAHRVR